MVLLNLYRGCSLKIVDVHIGRHISLRKNWLPNCLGIFATYHARFVARSSDVAGTFY